MPSERAGVFLPKRHNYYNVKITICFGTLILDPGLLASFKITVCGFKEYIFSCVALRNTTDLMPYGMSKFIILTYLLKENLSCTQNILSKYFIIRWSSGGPIPYY